jgi:DNA-binding MarR family transcriptional regulator
MTQVIATRKSKRVSSSRPLQPSPHGRSSRAASRLRAEPAPAADRLPSFEAELREFFGPRGVDLDAQAVVFGLFRASTDVIAALEGGALRSQGLSHAGFVLLMSLWITGAREVRDLASMQRVSRPAVVSCVDTLARAGLVRRVRSGDDRRLVRVELTPQGRALVEKAQVALHACERYLTSGLRTQEKRALADLLRRVGRTARERLHGKED